MPDQSRCELFAERELDAIDFAFLQASHVPSYNVVIWREERDAVARLHQPSNRPGPDDG